MKLVGLPTCPQDASPEIKAISTYISHKNVFHSCAFCCRKLAYHFAKLSSSGVISVIDIRMKNIS
jgi:hypothetical protein